jgi:hypothetical protein
MIHKGSGQTRPKDKRELSEAIERQTAELLAKKGKIERLPSEQRRPARSPAFNPGTFEGNA